MKSSVTYIITTNNLNLYFLLLCILEENIVSGLRSPANDYVEVGLKSHNKYRAAHNTDLLELDYRLVQNAMDCARYYANKGKIDHKCPYKARAGENLYWTSATDTGEEFDVNDAITLWYNEIKDYDFNRNDAKKGKKFKDIGHFTQLVWNGTKKLGIGIAKVAKGTYVVALYDPHGNINFPKLNKENVLPLAGHSGSIPKAKIILGFTIVITLCLGYVQCACL